MADLNPEKLHVRWMKEEDRTNPSFPRCYTLTHSDRTGDLFLTIGQIYDEDQISGWYTRLMRDEVLATWESDVDAHTLRIHCHVSGGWAVGSARWRYSILQGHLKSVIQSFRYGDRELFARLPALDQATVRVQFHSHKEVFNRTEAWGVMGEYRLAG
jgi:hypothetical protein